MRELTITEVEEINGGRRRFKFHFNVFQAIGAIFVGALTAGPVGVGYAIGLVITTQGLGQLHDMGVQEGYWGPLQ